MRDIIKHLMNDVCDKKISEEETLRQIEKIGEISTKEKEHIFMGAVTVGYVKVVTRFSDIFNKKDASLNRVFGYGIDINEEFLNVLIELANKYNFSIDYTYSDSNGYSVLRNMLELKKYMFSDVSALNRWLVKIKDYNPDYVLTEYELQALDEIQLNCINMEIFKLLFDMLSTNKEKTYFLERAIYESNLFENSNVYEVYEIFKPYVIAKNVTNEDITKLKELKMGDLNILKAMMFIPYEKKYKHSLEYFCNEVEFFTWDEEIKFKAIITNWYDWF